MMFYNGFNLMIDIILACIVGFTFYRIGRREGFIEGYGAGEQDLNDWYTGQLEPPLDDMDTTKIGTRHRRARLRSKQKLVALSA
jgi:hypothetical protein